MPEQVGDIFHHYYIIFWKLQTSLAWSLVVCELACKLPLPQDHFFSLFLDHFQLIAQKFNLILINFYLHQSLPPHHWQTSIKFQTFLLYTILQFPKIFSGSVFDLVQGSPQFG